MSALIGRDIDTGEDIHISDIARRSGLYVLGKPGMGKSNLLINLMLQDVQNGHGLFFLDPHSDAIDSILNHPSFRPYRERTTVLNPATDFGSFGINLLACENIDSLEARTATYTSAYNVFEQLWGDNWGPWLQLGLQNTLKAFIENQDYTLADVPLFLDVRNSAFRNHIVSNIKREPAVAAFWRQEFSLRRERDQQERVDAALTRINTLLTHQHIRHIVGQHTTTVDFSDALAKGRILLVELKASWPADSKRFIGTLIISELLHAVLTRPAENRSHFCIFVDEFQHFATDDFGTLITDARKFGVATTIAHQERFGQFTENPKALGATSAAANKVFFQLTVRDAQELAPEFAPSPDGTEVRREAVLAPSNRAIEDLWEKGHRNKELMQLRGKYFWIVDLLKRYPREQYFVYDPGRGEEYTPSMGDLHWTSSEFFDREMYRSSVDMINEAISLLDVYFYEWMQGVARQRGCLNKKENRLFMRVITCLGGLYGMRHGMYAHIPETMRRLILRHFIDNDERIVREEIARRHYHIARSQTETDEAFRYRLSRATAYGNRTLEEIPTIIHASSLDQWRGILAEAGLGEHEIEQSIAWAIYERTPIEDVALQEMVSLAGDIQASDDNYAQEVSRANDRYMLVMIQRYMFMKLGEGWAEDQANFKSFYYGLVTDRILWQMHELQRFSKALRIMGNILQQEPLRVATGEYEEKYKSEKTQAEHITETAQELAKLPRFTAYAKTLQTGDGGQQAVLKRQIRTLPSGGEAISGGNAELARKVALMLRSGWYKGRDEIDDEIAERQRPWMGSASPAPPPASARVAQSPTTTDAPPPSSVSQRTTEPPQPAAPMDPVRARGYGKLHEGPIQAQPHSASLQSLKDHLIPAVRAAVPVYEPLDAGVALTAMFALVLHDAEIGRRALQRILRYEDISLYHYAGEIAAMIGDLSTAERMISHLEEHIATDASHAFLYAYDIADIATRLPGTDIADRLLHQCETMRHYGAALEIATALPDTTAIDRLLPLIIADDLPSSAGGIKKLFGALMCAASYNPAPLKQWVRELTTDLENESAEYDACVGQLAAALGGDLETQAVLAGSFCIEKGKYLEAKMIDAILGRVASMKEMFQTYSADLTTGQILGILAKKQPDYVFSMVRALERRYETDNQKYFFAYGILDALEGRPLF